MLYSAPLPPELKLKKVPPEPLDELAEYLHPFAHHFKRSEGRQSLERHMSGLLADIDCKNGEQIAGSDECRWHRPRARHSARSGGQRVEAGGTIQFTIAQ